MVSSPQTRGGKVLRRLISKACNSITFGRVKVFWWSTASHSKEAPILIGGCDRSGTTLLYSLLNSHSKVCLGLETGLFAGNVDFEGLNFRLPTMSLAEIKSHYSKSCCLAE